MDPIIVASTVKQPVYFIAAGEYVGKGLKGWMFRKWLHMIPVFRPSTRPEDVHKNKDMFNHCFEHLSKGGSLLIFPEGVSVTERKIKPFKTGVARIARGAELLNQKKLDLKIVPIGLNYSNPHQFRSDVFIKVGNIIEVKNHISDDQKNEINEVEYLTELAENALHESTLHIEDEQDDAVLQKLDAIYSRDLKMELGIEFKEQEREFLMHKDMLSAITYFKTHAKEKFDDIVSRINHYTEKLDDAGLSDRDIARFSYQKTFFRIGSYILGLPFFLIGFVGNFIPYQLVLFLIRKIKIQETFLGSMVLAFGLVIFSAFYIGISVLLGLLTPIGIWAIFTPIVLYITGIYTQLYMAAIAYSFQRKNLRHVFISDKNKIDQLKSERLDLIATLEKFRKEFDQINSKII